MSIDIYKVSQNIITMHSYSLPVFLAFVCLGVISCGTKKPMFDPNDVNGKRVFAGGVSGGLWVNNDITDSNSAWSEVDIPANLAINCITYDPNNSATFYVGTGESYVGVHQF